MTLNPKQHQSPGECRTMQAASHHSAGNVAEAAELLNLGLAAAGGSSGARLCGFRV